jgi:hypothetical protein
MDLGFLEWQVHSAKRSPPPLGGGQQLIEALPPEPPQDRKSTLAASIGGLDRAAPAAEPFERTAAASYLSAEEIARCAQQFGQEDDITVLSLSLALCSR